MLIDFLIVVFIIFCILYYIYLAFLYIDLEGTPIKEELITSKVELLLSLLPFGLFLARVYNMYKKLE